MAKYCFFRIVNFRLAGFQCKFSIATKTLFDWLCQLLQSKPYLNHMSKSLGHTLLRRFLQVSVSQATVQQNHLEGLIKQIARPTPRVSDWAGLRWSLRICNSEKIPGDTDAAGLGTCFENLDLGHWKAICPHNVTVQVYTGQHFQNLRNPEPRVSLELCQKLNFRYPSQRHVSKVRGAGEHPLKHKTFGK